MISLVIDASVAVKWFLPEVHSDAARRWLDPDVEMFAPDLITAEVGNVLWKKARRGEISPANGRDILLDFRRFPIRLHASDELARPAWELAIRFERSFYDSLYLALGNSLGCPVVTADLRFYNALKDTTLASALLWVEAYGSAP